MATQVNLLQQVENATQRLGINNPVNFDPNILHPATTRDYLRSLRAVKRASHPAFLLNNIQKIALPADLCSAKKAEGSKMFNDKLMSLNTWVPSIEAWKGWGTHLAGIFHECAREMAVRHNAYADNIGIKIAAFVATFLTGFFEFLGILAASSLKCAARAGIALTLPFLLIACIATGFQDKEMLLFFRSAVEKTFGLPQIFSLFSNSPKWTKSEVELEIADANAPILAQLHAEKKSKRKYQALVAGGVAATLTGITVHAGLNGWLPTSAVTSAATTVYGWMASTAASVAPVALATILSPWTWGVAGTAAALVYGGYKAYEWITNS